MPTINSILKDCHTFISKTHTDDEKEKGDCIYKAIIKELILEIKKCKGTPSIVKKNISEAVIRYKEAFKKSYIISSDIPLPPNNLGRLIKTLEKVSQEEIINDYQENQVRRENFSKKIPTSKVHQLEKASAKEMLTEARFKFFPKKTKLHADGRDLQVAVLHAGKNLKH